jgi:hypothetical protein
MPQLLSYFKTSGHRPTERQPQQSPKGTASGPKATARAISLGWLDKIYGRPEASATTAQSKLALPPSAHGTSRTPIDAPAEPADASVLRDTMGEDLYEDRAPRTQALSVRRPHSHYGTVAHRLNDAQISTSAPELGNTRYAVNLYMLRQKVRIGLTSLAQNPTDPTRLKNALTEARRLLEAMASLSVSEREAIEQFLACLELLAAGEPAVSLDELMRKVETLGNSH